MSLENNVSDAIAKQGFEEDYQHEPQLEDALFGDVWDLIDAASDGLETAPRDLFVAEQQRDETPGIDAHIAVEDFEGFEQYLFETMKRAIRAASNVNTVWSTRKRAAEWLFASRTLNKQGVSFSEACRALGGRKFVIQARVQYQLYRAGVPYPEPIAFLSDPLAPAMCGELLFRYGEIGMNLGKLLWSWPGIRADVLEEQATERLAISASRVGDILLSMEADGYVGLKHGFWFYLSRNPDVYTMAGRRRFQWSKAFVGDYD